MGFRFFYRLHVTNVQNVENSDILQTFYVTLTRKVHCFREYFDLIFFRRCNASCVLILLYICVPTCTGKLKRISTNFIFTQEYINLQKCSTISLSTEFTRCYWSNKSRGVKKTKFIILSARYVRKLQIAHHLYLTLLIIFSSRYYDDHDSIIKIFPLNDSFVVFTIVYNETLVLVRLSFEVRCKTINGLNKKDTHCVFEYTVLNNYLRYQ